MEAVKLIEIFKALTKLTEVQQACLTNLVIEHYMCEIEAKRSGGVLTLQDVLAENAPDTYLQGAKSTRLALLQVKGASPLVEVLDWYLSHN